MLKYQYEKQEERKAWEMWLTKYPYWDEDTFIPFTEFYIKAKIPTLPKEKQSPEDILKKAQEIRKKVGIYKK